MLNPVARALDEAASLGPGMLDREATRPSARCLFRSIDQCHWQPRLPVCKCAGVEFALLGGGSLLDIKAPVDAVLFEEADA